MSLKTLQCTAVVLNLPNVWALNTVPHGMVSPTIRLILLLLLWFVYVNLWYAHAIPEEGSPDTPKGAVTLGWELLAQRTALYNEGLSGGSGSTRQLTEMLPGSPSHHLVPSLSVFWLKHHGILGKASLGVRTRCWVGKPLCVCGFKVFTDPANLASPGKMKL